MTEIEQKALALMNEVSDERAIPRWTTFYRKKNGFVEALCRALEAHEAFKQEVSDIVYSYVYATKTDDWETLKSLIVPKPDPLVEALKELAWDEGTVVKNAGHIRAELEARGYEIREKGQ